MRWHEGPPVIFHIFGAEIRNAREPNSRLCRGTESWKEENGGGYHSNDNKADADPTSGYGTTNGLG